MAAQLVPLRADRAYGRAIGFRYHDGEPSVIEGLLSRGDRRAGVLAASAGRRAVRFDGWSEHFSFARWAGVQQGTGRRAAWST